MKEKISELGVCPNLLNPLFQIPDEEGQMEEAARLRWILAQLSPKNITSILVLGLGNESLVTTIVKGYPRAQVVSLTGTTNSMENATFDVVIVANGFDGFTESRIKEVKRILRPRGRFFLSEPIPSDLEKFKEHRFVDAYFQWMSGNTVEIHSSEEWQQFVQNAGFEVLQTKKTQRRITNKVEESGPMEELVRQFDSRIIEAYHLRFGADKVSITEYRINLWFQKK